MKKITWLNWGDFQGLAANNYQQVDLRITRFILQCGFTWSPAPAPNQPILLTPMGGKTADQLQAGINGMETLGFKLAIEDVVEPSMENGFNIEGYLKNAWGSLGVKV